MSATASEYFTHRKISPLADPALCINFPLLNLKQNIRKMERFWILLPLCVALMLLTIPSMLCFAEGVDAGQVFGGDGEGFGWGGGSGGFGGGYGGDGGGSGIGGFGGGYGGGGGGSGIGGFGRGGVFRPEVICREKGPCMNKKLICPQRCFKSFYYGKGGRNGGGGGGGGGGGCSIDCKHKCRADC